MLASDQPGCCGVAARLPKNPGTQKLTPLSSANARWEKNMIAGAKTIAATPNLRRCAEIGRPHFAAASAILAVILSTVSVWPSNKIRRHRNPGAGGAHHVNSARVHLPEKNMDTAAREQQA